MSTDEVRISRRQAVSTMGKIAIVGGVAIVAGAGGLYYITTTSKPPAGSKGTLTIGVPTTVSGYFASSGEEVIRGITMAVEDINASGGLLGYLLKVAVADGGTPGGFYTAQSTQTAISSLAQQGVDAMITSYLDAPVDIKTAANYDIPYIHVDTYAGVETEIQSNPSKYWMVWMADPNEKLYGSSLPDFLNGLISANLWKPSNKTADILTIDIGYNTSIRDAFVQNAPQKGWQIGVNTLFETSQLDWTSLLSQIKAKPGSFLFFDDHVVADDASFMKQFLQSPTQSLVFQQYGPSSPDYINLAKDNANGVIWSTVIGLIPDAKGLAWAQKYRSRWGADPGFGNAPIGYDDVMIWAEAVKSVGDPKDRRAVATAVGNSTYKGLCGNYKFSQTTHSALAGSDLVPTLFFQIQNQQQKLVSPTDLISSRNVDTPGFKLPPWLT